MTVTSSPETMEVNRENGTTLLHFSLLGKKKELSSTNSVSGKTILQGQRGNKEDQTKENEKNVWLADP